MKTNPFAVIVTFIALSIMGCCLIPYLPVKLIPSRTLPGITVSFNMPGNSAKAIESEVTSRVEGALSRLRGVRKLESRSSEGYGYVSVSLDRHTDLEKARFEISALMLGIWDELPEGVSYPRVSAESVEDGADRPFMTLTLNAPSNPAEIQAYGENNLKPILASVDGVNKVELTGANPMEWQLTYDADRLKAHGITPSDIREALNGNNGKNFPLNLQEITIPLPDGDFVSLDKLVSVSHVESRPTELFRVNGLNSIYINIFSEAGANQMALAGKVRDKLTDFARNSPPGYEVETIYDATEEIGRELDNIYFRSSLTILILLVFVGLASLNLRYVLLIASGLFMNLAIAVIFYYFSGIEIQLYSLAGITISLNLIIDNLIVMADHYRRNRDIRAFTAILAATLTTVIALSAVYFLDEETKLSLEDFVNVVIINLIVSLAVALFLVPALADKLKLSESPVKTRSRNYSRRIELYVFYFYSASVRLILRFRVALISVIILVFGGSVWIFVDKVYNGAYWNRDPGEVRVNVSALLPTGSTIEQMDALVKKMEAHLSTYKEISQFQTRISGPKNAHISISIAPDYKSGGFPEKLYGDLVSKALTLGGGSWYVSYRDKGFSNDTRAYSGGYRIKIKGYNYEELSRLGFIMRDSLMRRPRIKEVDISSKFYGLKEDYTEFSFEPDREALAKAGITASQLFTSLESMMGRGIACGYACSGRNREQIKLYSEQSRKLDILGLMSIPISVGSKIFKLSDLGKIEKRQAPHDILRENREYVLCLQYDYIGSEKTGMRLLEEDVEKFNTMLPEGYNVTNESQFKSRRIEGSNYWLLGMIAVVIFFTTSILFNSLRQPFSIIAMIPISFIGAFLAFYFFCRKMDQGGFASFVLLAGITVNAAIYLLNEYRNLCDEYPTSARLKLYVRAFQAKITPVLMTIFSTIIGFVPFLVGADRESFWYPLAVGTIGGLTVSLIGIIFYLPIFSLKKRPNVKHTV